MMLKKILNKINTLFVTLSLATMVFAPVAMGAEAERLSKKQAESIVQELGLNKSMTLNEFYKKNKYMFPERIQKQMEILVKKFGNEKMPTVEVATSQGKDGDQIPVLRLSSGNQLTNIQLTADDKQFAKFDNVSLMAEDVVNFDDMFLRLYNGDHNNRKKAVGDLEAAASKKTPVKVIVKKSKSMPLITDKGWKNMTELERVQYTLKVRAMWESAQNVLRVKDDLKKSKTKSSSYNLFEIFFANDAIAAEKQCIVAGYVSAYDKKGVCTINNALTNFYSDDKLVKAAQSYCVKTNGNSSVACNPKIYGAPKGNPACINKSDKALFNKATHATGPCEEQSKLSVPNDFPILNNDTLKNKDRYSAENLKKDALDKFKNENSEDDYKFAMKFMADLKAFADKNKVDGITSDTDIFNMFNKEIEDARSACVDASRTVSKHENNFWEACDQLHRRKLALQAYANEECKKSDPNSTVTDNNTCTCPAPVPPKGNATSPKPPTDVNMGEKCEVPKVPIVDQLTEKDPAKPTEEVAQGAQCGGLTCKANEECKIESSPLTQSRTEKCVPRLDLGLGFGKDSQGEKKSDFWGGIKSFFTAAAPWLLGGVVLFAVYKLWSPKKPSKKSAADFCPNGTRPPCGLSCPAPQALLSSGVCGCAACPPGQTISNQSSCSCTTSTSVSIITCADGVTQVSDITLCPTETNYTCWNGTVVTNPINCPTQPVTKPTGVGTDR